jgi:hypothetical protein
MLFTLRVPFRSSASEGSMQIDTRAHPTVLKRLSVVRLDTMLPIGDIAWADDETGNYGTYKRSGPVNGVETNEAGDPIIIEHSMGRGAIRIVTAR